MANADRPRRTVPRVRNPRFGLIEDRLPGVEARLNELGKPITPISMAYFTDGRVRDDDLVTLSEFAQLSGLERTRVATLENRQRRGLADYGFPPPKVEGRSIRLWSARELIYWWNRR